MIPPQRFFSLSKAQLLQRRCELARRLNGLRCSTSLAFTDVQERGSLDMDPTTAACSHNMHNLTCTIAVHGGVWMSGSCYRVMSIR